MTGEGLPELSSELLDDFFTECEEHLTHIRETLVLLERSIGKAQAESKVVEELFRHFHSFKGISAIVGLRAAEELAHAAEDFLRQLMRGALVLTQAGLDLLMHATQRLEQIAGAFRARRPVPSADPLAAELQAACGTPKADTEVREKAAADPVPSTSEAVQPPGSVLWKIVFSPTKELDERGININAVRKRLSDLGEILKATPQVRAGGSLVFEFVVAMQETPADIAQWERDGLVADLQEPAAAASARTASSPEEHTPFLAPSHVVRVELPRLDNLMRIVGEMVIKRSRFEDELNRASRKGASLDLAALREVNTGFSRSLRELREAIMHVRMVPVAEIFARMPFVVRDLARESRKKARLVLEGQNTEVDKFLIEQLKDPLLHLVRNSFSHGVENPEARRAAGKSEEATITLTAAAGGDSVVISVADDGRGVDRQAVLARAREMGLSVPELVDDSALLEILCSPGFSTRTDADLAAGRGVGMAVVQNTVRALGGTLTLETQAQQGSRFHIRVPLTLAIAETLIVSASDQTCAVPQNFVSEVLSIGEDELRKVNGVEVVPYRDGILPVVRLSAFFRLERRAQGNMALLVLRSDRGSSGLLVDRIYGQREVVVRPIRDPLIQTVGVAGATELGDGRPVLILDGAAFTSGVVRPNRAENPVMQN